MGGIHIAVVEIEGARIFCLYPCLPLAQMLGEVIITSRNSCSTDFENEGEKNKIAVNTFKTWVKSPGPNPALLKAY